jgi:hypothetical protein
VVDDIVSIEFFIDEHLPAKRLTPILTARGHVARAVHVGFKDPAILVTADEVGAVIITADGWFLRELLRFPTGHHRRYKPAGVVKVAGEWDIAQARLVKYLPLIELYCRAQRAEPDPRIGVDLSEAEIRFKEPQPGPAALTRTKRRANTRGGAEHTE